MMLPSGYTKVPQETPAWKRDFLLALEQDRRKEDSKRWLCNTAFARWLQRNESVVLITFLMGSWAAFIGLCIYMRF